MNAILGYSGNIYSNGHNRRQNCGTCHEMNCPIGEVFTSPNQLTDLSWCSMLFDDMEVHFRQDRRGLALSGPDGHNNGHSQLCDGL